MIPIMLYSAFATSGELYDPNAPTFSATARPFFTDGPYYRSDCG